MPTSSYSKFDQFVEDVAHGVHNLGSDSLMVALCSEGANAPAATDEVLADLTTVALTFLADATITVSASSQTSGTYTLALADKTLSASGGAVGAFRYVIIYNDTPTSPANPLIGWWDYGGDITLADGESLVVDFAASTLTLV
jgi:hypothetical protein